MQTKLSLAALAAVVISGAALAQGIPPPTSTTSPSSTPGIGAEYTKMDKDKDGTLSKREISSNKDLTKQWDTLDVNKDGKLDEAEFAQFESESMSSDTLGKDGKKDDLRKDSKPNY